jgi:hypothetical protein
MRSRVSTRGTSASAMWTVASTTRSSGESNIIATNGVPVRCARRSGVAAPGEPGERESLFADGRGCDGVDAARHRVLDGAHDNVVGGAPCRRRHEPRLDGRGRGRGRGVHDGLADVEHPRVCGGLAGDLGPDARGIAHGQRDSRPHAARKWCLAPFQRVRTIARFDIPCLAPLFSYSGVARAGPRAAPAGAAPGRVVAPSLPSAPAPQLAPGVRKLVSQATLEATAES